MQVDVEAGRLRLSRGELAAVVDGDLGVATPVREVVDAVAGATHRLVLDRADRTGRYPMRGWLGAGWLVLLPEQEPDREVEVVAMRAERTPRVLARLVALGPRPEASGSVALPEDDSPVSLAALLADPDAEVRRWRLGWEASDGGGGDAWEVVDLPAHGL